jgi:hypothetical protein
MFGVAHCDLALCQPAADVKARQVAPAGGSAYVQHPVDRLSALGLRRQGGAAEQSRLTVVMCLATGPHLWARAGRLAAVRFMTHRWVEVAGHGELAAKSTAMTNSSCPSPSKSPATANLPLSRPL